jgi:adenosylcobinamide kinase/adenosylcobinamide-phosphate guanylyltransferase
VSLLVLGGARSGKSRFALESAPRPGVFVATAEARDADMERRIARHRRERGPAWLTVEEPVDLGRALGALVDQADSVVVDCLTLWVANRQLRGDSDEAILQETERIAHLIAEPPFDLVLVTNEVGAGVHPETADGVRFRDLLGRVNQRVAAVCDRVILMVAGLPVPVKDLRPSPAVHARPRQVP